MPERKQVPAEYGNLDPHIVNMYLTASNTFNMLPETGIVDFGTKPTQISYNITRALLRHEIPGIKVNTSPSKKIEQEITIDRGTPLEDQTISLALQLQGFTQKERDESAKNKGPLVLTRKVALTLVGDILMNVRFSSPLYASNPSDEPRSQNSKDRI